MRISRIRIKNFANFAELDLETGEDIVIVGENKVGKSNLLFALQLVLDPGLSERDRQLGLEHFWDGLGDKKLGQKIEISVDLTGFDDDARLLAHLGDAIVEAGPPLVSRLTYRFQPKAGLTNPPRSTADYEFVLFGGDKEENSVLSSLRRMLPLDVLPALRDAEKDLSAWRRSPLRPLIEGLVGDLGDADREAIQKTVDDAQNALADRKEVKLVAETVSDRLESMVGKAHATPLALGLAPTRIDALVRALRLLIDDGARGVADASLGTANLIFLALKSLELDRLVAEGDRDHTFLAVEEPEAHLHPHVQRLVYRHFLGAPKRAKPAAAVGGAAAATGYAAAADQTQTEKPRCPEPSRLTTVLTTHSPHIASIAPLRSIVLLRRGGAARDRTVGVSTANTPLTDKDVADIQRYIDVTRGELLFARGIMLVEGDAERFLAPAFAEALGFNLDRLGVTVCSIAGTNFTPYVKLLGSKGLNIPFVLVTDRDPPTDPAKQALAVNRIRKLLELVRPGVDHTSLDEPALYARGRDNGMFVNSTTLETELFGAGLSQAMGEILTEELSLSAEGKTTLKGWIDDPTTLDGQKLIAAIERVGKGRFAQRLADHVTDDTCPEYLRLALERIHDAVA